MAYGEFKPEIPSVTEDAATIWDSVRNNDTALLHMLSWGAPENWDSTPVIGTGSAQQPDEILFTYNPDTAPNQRRIRIELTWGTSGPSENQVTQIILSYSTDSGSNYDLIRTATFAYSEAGAIPSVTWS